MAQRGNDVATRDVTMVLLKEAFVSLTALRRSVAASRDVTNMW
jgi:hypothetical protein